ncbi:hypothetical protein BDR06DRAFT_1001670 [Suillus hirtellus]|nr:hypothetical protein BDR06DRAFT_1001670 [Suillus hirtellus]
MLNAPHTAHADSTSHSSLLRSNNASPLVSTHQFPSSSIPQYSARYAHLTSTQTVIDKVTIDAFNSFYYYDPVLHALVYKPVAKKVRTVPTTMPAEYRVDYPTYPPIPQSSHQAHTDKLDLDPANWLWPEELKLVRWLVRVHELAFAWDASECRCLNETYFPPYKIPMVPHTPWC